MNDQSPWIGKQAPAFALKADSGDMISLDDFKGRYIVLYFYPKDSTPGCTTEAIDFSTLKDNFETENAVILGASRDSVKRHDNFIAKQNLSIRLLSDESGKLTEDYGVWVEKKMYGKTYMGIERATFLIDPEGVIRAHFPKVKVKGHAQTVLETLKQIRANG